MAIKPIKVSQINGYIKRVLQADPMLGNVSVVGEISNIKFHGTGHVYFTLKDENSKLSCFLPSDVFQRIRYQLDNGMEIVATGYIYLYEKGGSYSLNIRDIDVAGIGDLAIAFEKLKEKLDKEGLFHEKYKKDIPFFPKKIAIITSETGAAVKDILKIIKTRNNYVDVIIFPVLVQGKDAAADIAGALKIANKKFPDIDVIIAGRGGGSMEELWAFNEEIVARAIFDSKIPVISAVGHETDFTIADFVADRRAETPTAAAAMAAPDIESLRMIVKDYYEDMRFRMDNKIRNLENKIRLYDKEALYRLLKQKAESAEHRLDTLHKELLSLTTGHIDKRKTAISALYGELAAMNPDAVIKRGFTAIVGSEGQYITSVTDLFNGMRVTARMRDGKAEMITDRIVKD